MRRHLCFVFPPGGRRRHDRRVCIFCELGDGVVGSCGVVLVHMGGAFLCDAGRS